jgi:hypothetical protein
MITINRRITEVVNNTGSTALFFDQVLAPGEVWEIVDRKMEMWRDDPSISGAITSGTLGVRDGTQEFSSTGRALQYFYNNPGSQTTFNWPVNSLVTLVSGVDELGNIDYSIERKAVTTVGNISVVSGTDGLEITVTEDDDVDSVTVSGVTFTGSVVLANIGGGQLLPDIGSNTITISGGASVEDIFTSEGKIYKHSFGNNGIIADKWAQVGHGNSSDQTPHQIVFSSLVVGLAYSNQRMTTDVDVEIWKAVAASGVEAELMFTWELRDTRVARKSNLEVENILFAPGDKLAMFLSKPVGTPGVQNPQDPVIDVYMQIDEALDEEGSESFSGDIGD